MTNPTPDAGKLLELQREAYTIEWWGTEDRQHKERMKACRDRRRVYPDDDCGRDGSCSECEWDMIEVLETKASKQRRIEALTRAQSPAPIEEKP